MNLFYKVLVAAVVVVLVYCSFRADFYVWQLKHPQAPAWTYFWGR